MIAPGTVVDVVFVNDGVTVVNGVRTEDRNLIVESISVGGATPMVPTASGVTVDQGDGMAAFDGVSTLPGQTGLWWNAALRFTVPATNIGSAPTLKVRARATLAGGIGAKMVVRVGGAIIGTVDVNNVGTAADYSLALAGATPSPAVPAGTGVDVVYTNDGVTVVNGARTEDRNLIVESLSVGGGTPMLPTASGVTVDQGDGAAAFDGIDTLPGQGGLWWNAALRFAVPAANIGTGSTLIVRAKATLAGGIGANMVVRVGGVVVGSATVSNTAAYADYSFPIAGAGGGSSGATATGWSYDANSLPTAIVQKTGGLETGRWTYQYSDVGSLTQTTNVKNGRVEKYVSYDAHGRAISGTASDGAAILLQYNLRGQISHRVLGATAVGYGYSARGELSTVTTAQGTISYQRDSSGRVSGVANDLLYKETFPSAVLSTLPKLLDQWVGVFASNVQAQAVSACDNVFMIAGSGVLHIYSSNGTLLMVTAYTSGLPGVTDYRIQGEGPIPPGRYSFRPNEISSATFFRRHIDPRDWGEYRVGLTPDPGTSTFGRTGFMMHGGVRPGSAGCIDVGRADKDVFERLKKACSPVAIFVTSRP